VTSHLIIMPDIQEKVKQTVKEEVDRVARLSTDAVRSYAYLYPFRVRIMLFLPLHCVDLLIPLSRVSSTFSLTRV